jgi:hypothetical protein
MTFSIANRRVTQALLRRSGVVGSTTQLRSHHPDPFNPKQTRGWKAALKVRKENTT